MRVALNIYQTPEGTYRVRIIRRRGPQLRYIAANVGTFYSLEIALAARDEWLMAEGKKRKRKEPGGPRHYVA